MKQRNLKTVDKVYTGGQNLIDKYLELKNNKKEIEKEIKQIEQAL